MVYSYIKSNKKISLKLIILGNLISYWWNIMLYRWFNDALIRKLFCYYTCLDVYNKLIVLNLIISIKDFYLIFYKLLFFF